MFRKSFQVVLAFLALVAVAAAQTSPPQNQRAQQNATITTVPFETNATDTFGMHQAAVQFKFGTVAGTYSTCTVQARTTYDGDNYYSLGSAVTLTVTSNTNNSWRIVEASGTGVSTTAAVTFGVKTKYAFSCSSYGTTAPVVINAEYFATDAAALGGGSGGGGVVTQPDGSMLHISCDAGCSSSPAPADKSAFTAGTTSMTPQGGFYQSSRDTLTTATAAAIALNVNRAQLIQIEDASKNAIGSTANALDVNIKSGGATGVAQGSTTSGQLGTLTQGAVTTAAPAYTTGQTSPLSIDTAGGLRVNVGTPTVTANAGTGTFQVQSNSANLATETTLATLSQTQGSTTSGQKGTLEQGAVTTNAPSYTTGQTSPLSLTTAGALRVDNSASTQPVSGTVTANAGTGTMGVGGNVASGNADSGNPVKTGAVFNTTQPTVTTGQRVDLQADSRGDLRGVIMDGNLTNGAAYVNSSHQLTTSVDNQVTLATATNNIGTIGVTQGSTTAGQFNALVGGAVTTSSPSYTNAQTSPLSLDTSGGLRVSVISGSTGNAAASATGSAVPAQGGYTGVNVGGTLRGVTATNTSGSVYAMDVNIAGGSAGNGAASNTGSAVPAQGDYSGVNVGGTLRGQTGVNPTGTVYAAQGDIASIAGTVADVNSGNKSNGTLRVTIATDQVQLTNALKVDGSGVTQPVSVPQSNITADFDTGAGTQTTTMYGLALPASGGAVAGGTATNPLRVDPTGTTTQPVSGTVTANAGTGTFSVQSNSANIATEASLAKLTQTQGSTTSGQSGPLIQGAVTTSSPSYTTAQTSPLSLDTSGSLRVAVVSGSTGNAAAGNTGSSVPAQADYSGLNVGGTLRGATAVNPSGTVYAQQFDIASVAGSTVATAASGIQKVAIVDSNGNAITNSDIVAVKTDQTTPGTTDLVHATQIASTSTTTTMQNAATASGNGTVLAVDGMSSAILTVNCSSCSGGTTINFEAQNDGTNFAAVNATLHNSSVIASTTTTAGLTYWQIPVAGWKQLRARISGYSAGTVTVTGTTVPVDFNSRTTNSNLFLAGTAVDANSGNKSSGTIRVVLATDQPALTNKLLVTPDANSAVNVAQMNGVAVTMGNGAAGTGVQRVAIASDNSAIAGAGVGATAGAVPANAVYAGAQDASGNLIGDVVCTSSKIYDASTNGNTELVAISGSKHIYVCGYEILAAGTVNVSLVTGTGTACASAASGTPSTGTSGASAGLTPAWQFTTQTGKLSAYPSHGWLLDTGSANALCLKTSAGVAVQAQVFYSQR